MDYVYNGELINLGEQLAGREECEHDLGVGISFIFDWHLLFGFGGG